MSSEQDRDPRLSRRAVVRGALLGGAAVGAGGLLAACGSDSSGTASSATSGTQTASGDLASGGTLKVGLTGGSSKDTLDAHKTNPDVDAGRACQLYEPVALRNPQYEYELVLAESLEPTKSGAVDHWTIRLRDGVEFHNGKTLSAEDLIFTLNRILDPKDPKSGSAFLSYVDVKRLKKVDERTVGIPLKTPNSGFPEDIGQYLNGIVPVGYDPKSPVGTGPYKYQSFDPGQRSVFVRNENYWRTGEPHFDELVILDLSDDAARLNALLSGEVDAISNAPVAQLSTLESNSAVKVMSAETGNFQPITMRVDKPPFDDVRVRQAFKLIVDRDQMVAQAHNGQGRVANDLFSPFDPDFADDIPQREQDLEQAKSLLQAAGHSGVTVELITAPAYAGMVEAAQVFAQQAKGAGVNVKVNKVDTNTFFGPSYLNAPFSQDYWFTRSLLTQIAYELLPTSSFNETHYDDPRFNKLVAQARAAGDDATRREALHEAQRMIHDEGGLIVHTFSNQIDAYRADLVGFQPAKTGLPLGNYDFRSTGRKA